MTKTSEKWHAYGRRLQQLKRTSAAENAYKNALRDNPARLDTLNNLIVLLRQEKRFDEAEELFIRSQSIAENEWRKVTNKNRQDALASDWARLLNSGSLLALEQSQHGRCRNLLYQQLLLDPEGCGTINLGVALDALGRNSAASRCHALGLIRHGLPFQEPTTLIGKQLRSNEQSSQLHKELCNLATSLLKTEPFKTENWRLLLARLGQESNSWSLPESPWHRLWKGEHCQSLLIWDEQGFGDSMQCLRWINMASTRTKRLLLMLRPSLIRLVKKRLSLVECCQFITMPDTGPPLSSFKYHCPLMALPVAMADGMQEIPHPTPSQGHWLERNIKTPSQKKRIGLVWKAGTKSTENAQRASNERSIPGHLLVKQALKWADQQDIELISLQRDHQEAEIEKMAHQGKIKVLADDGDWETTARCLEQIDLVISVDTAIVHLAGNLGIPCMLLLNKVHDWRWGSPERPTCWYPNQTVLRCRHTNQWEGLLEEADSLMKSMINE